MTEATKRVVLALLIAVASPWAAGAQVGFSPDITVDLGGGPSRLLNDEDVAADDGAGGVYGPFPGVGLIPASADVMGWHPTPLGESYLSFDITIALPGLVAPAEPRDVVKLDPVAGTFSLLFDGSSAGVPSNVQVDAVSENANGELLLSFDTTATLPGGITPDDEDVVRWDGLAFSMVFDGSAAGVATSTDLDGVHDPLNGVTLLVSFDTSGSIAGLFYDDEDVLEYDTGGGTFAMFHDSSTTDPADWPSADLVALPEPGRVGALAGVLLLTLLAGARRARGRSRFLRA